MNGKYRGILDPNEVQTSAAVTSVKLEAAVTLVRLEAAVTLVRLEAAVTLMRLEAAFYMCGILSESESESEQHGISGYAVARLLQCDSSLK